MSQPMRGTEMRRQSEPVNMAKERRAYQKRQAKRDRALRQTQPAEMRPGRPPKKKGRRYP